MASLKQWVIQQGFADVPFDKLILKLDRLGIELSVSEQDVLRRLLNSRSG